MESVFPTASPRQPVRGRFIVFEGIDGSGKSTVSRRVAEHLEGSNANIHWTLEPTDTAAGKAVRAAIEGRHDPIGTTLLFVADRIEHAKDIEARLEAGQTVICDRYWHSTLAYQSVTLKGRMESPMAWLQGLHDSITLRPDRVVLLDLPAKTAVARAEARGTTDPFEKVEFLESVRSAYLDLAKAEPDVVRVINAGQSPDAVFAAALAALN